MVTKIDETKWIEPNRAMANDVEFCNGDARAHSIDVYWIVWKKMTMTIGCDCSSMHRRQRPDEVMAWLNLIWMIWLIW